MEQTNRFVRFFSLHTTTKNVSWPQRATFKVQSADEKIVGGREERKRERERGGD